MRADDEHSFRWFLRNCTKEPFVVWRKLRLDVYCHLFVATGAINFLATCAIAYERWSLTKTAVIVAAITAIQAVVLRIDWVSVRENLTGMAIQLLAIVGQTVAVPTVADPPRLAEFLVGLFAKKRHRAGLLHCLDEDFRADLAAGMSLARAKRRYWAAALNSLGPQLWAAIKRVGVIGLVAGYIRGKLG
jgi:hypothetical protein